MANYTQPMSHYIIEQILIRDLKCSPSWSLSIMTIDLDNYIINISKYH